MPKLLATVMLVTAPRNGEKAVDFGFGCSFGTVRL